MSFSVFFDTVTRREVLLGFSGLTYKAMRIYISTVVSSVWYNLAAVMTAQATAFVILSDIYLGFAKAVRFRGS